jgi:hypothetical protein
MPNICRYEACLLCKSIAYILRFSYHTYVVVNCDNVMPVSKVQFASYGETQNLNFEIMLQYYTIDMANIIMKYS